MQETPSQNRPPNYNSRTMQFRLLVLVGGLMLVLVMMDEARKPENWMWMGFKMESEEGQRQEPTVSPRLADLFRSSSEDNSLFQALARNPSEGEGSQNNPDDPLNNPLDETVLQVLRRCFGQLNDDQIQRLFIDLDQLLSFETLAADTKSEREQIAARMERVVEFELSQYRRLVERTAEDQLNHSDENAPEEQDWGALLDQAQVRFDLLNSLLRSTLRVDELTIGQLEEVTHIQQQLDQVALEQIEDNTLGPRAAEQHAWYRTFELMQQVEQEGVNHANGRVTTFDLAQQPDRYRGRWVELQGQVREIKKVSLANNREGFQDYWELWVRPDSGPDVPFCVYARSLPEGFPQPTSASESMSLKESVTIIGCFFKNMSYRAVGGLRVSPLVLVVKPQWSPQPTQVAETPALPSWQEMAGIATICLLVAVMVAWWVYRATKLRLPARHRLDRTLLLLSAISLGLGGMAPIVSGQDDRAGATARPPWLLPDQTDSAQADFHSVYQLFEDIEPSQLDRLGDFQALNSNEPIVQQILSRLAVVGPRWLEKRSQVLNRDLAEVVSRDPSGLRGEFIRCRGAIQSVELVELSEATWNQFERDVVFRIELNCDLGDGLRQPVIVYSNHVPPAWEALSFPVDEASVAGVFIQLGESHSDGQPQPILLADRVGWFPIETPMEPWQQFWCEQGFDYGRWEVARSQEGRPLQAADGSCFYGLLSRASQVDLRPQATTPPIETLDLFEVLRDPNEQRGAIFQFQGIVKRVTEISTGEDLYAIDEGVSSYFQIDMLLSLDGRRVRLGTQEKGATITGRYPVTVCVQDLPNGLEVGEDLSQRVSVLAAFFRNWKYRSEYLRRVDEDLRQLSPMLIGLEIQTQGMDESSTFLTQIAVGVLIIGAVLSGLGFLFMRRSDIKYQRERTRLKKAELPDQLDWPEESDS